MIELKKQPRNAKEAVAMCMTFIPKHIRDAPRDKYGRRLSIKGIPQTIRNIVLSKPPLSEEELKRLIDPKVRDWAPIRKISELPPRPEIPVFVDNRNQPVIVSVRGGNEIARYENMDEFDKAHDKKTYPVKQTANYEGTTLVLVTAKPWAGKERPEKAPGERRSGRSKVNVIGEMLLRPEGITTADVLAATGWPSVSMPAQAKLAGLKLRKEKVKGQPTRYWGTKG